MSISINATPVSGGTFTVSAVGDAGVNVSTDTADSVNLTVAGGVGPPGAGNVALAAGTGILITSTVNVATINCTVEGVPESVLENLSNVFNQNATTGDVLAYNGTAWASSSNYATLTYVDNAVANLVDAAPGALDTLNELAAAIGDDANFSATITTSLASKAAANHTHTFQEITNGTATVTGNLTLDPSTGGVIISGGTSAGSLTLNCEQNTHGVTIQSPAHSENATYTLTLPSSAGSANQVLTTDGTGSLSWSAGSSGGISWTSPAPGNSSDSGSAGDVAYGGQYFYLHNGTQWNRVLLSSFGSASNTTSSNLQTENGSTLTTESGNSLGHDGTGTGTGGGSGNIAQLGSDIDGEAAGDQFGYSVGLSNDGSRLIVGAPNNDGTGTDAGHVRVYSWSGSAWSQLGADIDAEASGDFFGGAVDISSDGNRVAIGARYNDGTSSTASTNGHVRVYSWSGSAWSQLGADIDAEATDDQFGTAVSLSADGSRLAIGAPKNDGNAAADAGHVRIFDWSGSAWVQVGSDINGELLDDNSGAYLSLAGDGTRVAIGAAFNDGTGANAGHVRVYSWSGSAWTQLGSDIDAEALGDAAAIVDLSSDGSRLAIGAIYNDGTGYNAGHVRVYSWSGSAWVQLGADIDGEASSDFFGHSVAISDNGSRLIVGASQNDGGGTDAGSVRVYDWSGSAWVQVGSDVDGEAAWDRSGFAVAVSGDGSRFAVGAYSNDGTGTDAGSVRVYGIS